MIRNLPTIPSPTYYIPVPFSHCAKRYRWQTNGWMTHCSINTIVSMNRQLKSIKSFFKNDQNGPDVSDSDLSAKFAEDFVLDSIHLFLEFLQPDATLRHTTVDWIYLWLFITRRTHTHPHSHLHRDPMLRIWTCNLLWLSMLQKRKIWKTWIFNSTCDDPMKKICNYILKNSSPGSPYMCTSPSECTQLHSYAPILSTVSGVWHLSNSLNGEGQNMRKPSHFFRASVTTKSHKDRQRQTHRLTNRYNRCTTESTYVHLIHWLSP